MDFGAVDPNTLLDAVKEDPALFAKAVVQMQLVDNYDNRMPSGLSEFSRFFYAYHKQVYALGKDRSALHQLFLDWLKEKRQRDRP